MLFSIFLLVKLGKGLSPREMRCTFILEHRGIVGIYRRTL